MQRTRAVAIALVAASAATWAGPAAHQTSVARERQTRAARETHTRAATAGLAVTGYAEEGTAPRLVKADAPALTTVGVDGVNINARGTTGSLPDSGALTLLRQAHGLHLRAEFLIGNWSNSLNDFDPAAAHALLSSGRNIARVAARLARAVRSEGWDGITIDLESLDSSDGAGLVRFVTALKADVPKGRTVSVDISAQTSVSDYVANGYDLAGLAAHANRLVLMAYDDHGPTWSGPGPIGGLPWQRQSLAALRRLVPSGKIDLGEAGYGYTWPKHGTGVQLSDSQARRMVRRVGAKARWSRAQGEWTATLPNGTVLWWSDARSWSLRVTMARRDHLHGMALWSIGLADRLPT